MQLHFSAKMVCNYLQKGLAKNKLTALLSNLQDINQCPNLVLHILKPDQRIQFFHGRY
jgi:hypothetical protein